MPFGLDFTLDPQGPGLETTESTAAPPTAEAMAPETGGMPDGDIPVEPHAVLQANASYEDTKFEKGPIWVYLEMTPEEANESTDELHLVSGSGEYDECLAIVDGYVAGSMVKAEGEDGCVPAIIVQFADAPMSETYSLELVPEEGDAYWLFEGVPYGTLRPRDGEDT